MRDLKAQGYEIDYASAGEEKVLDADREIKIDFPRSPLKLAQIARAYQQMVKLLQAEEYILIHTHTPVGGVVTRMAAKKVAKNLPPEQRPAVLYTGHGFHFYKGAPLINWLVFYPIEKWLAKSTDAVITINHEDYHLAKRKFPVQHVEIIPGAGVDLTKFHSVTKAQKWELRKAHGYKKSDFILIYVAELNDNKDQMSIIQNAAALITQIPKLKILFVGSGPAEEELRAKAHETQLDDVVDFLGYRHDVDELYQLSDVVISASRREGLGLNLIEGMACGLSAVARDNRGHREIITSSKNGILYKNGAAMREAILKLYQSPEKRTAISKYNIEAMQKFAVENTLAKMRKIYQRHLKS